MKKRLRIILLSLAAIVFMVSFTSKEGKNEIFPGACNPIFPDTISVTHWIKVDSFDLSILLPSSGVHFYRDGIVFLSSSRSDGKMTDNHISFGKTDARYSVLEDNSLKNPQSFSPSLPFPYPCEAITFSGDYNTMYFTKYSEIQGAENIFKANFTKGEGNQGKWTFDENPLNFCSDKSTYTHPALSADGKLMIFASNRPGSIGGMDLFVSQEKGGKWTDPVNLGDAVNSQANELYPYLDSENNLFFSSDNIQGYGGYDIYVCKFKSNTWEKPINLSTPINTRFDDVAFTVNRKDGKSAFYTVKQNSGKRSLQLYSVNMNRSIPDTLLTLSQYFTRPDISHMVILALEPAVQATDRKTETAISRISDSPGQSYKLIYRVQFMTSFNPRTRSVLNLNGKDYNVFEYLYSGAYRLCVGEFNTLSPAIELQNLLKGNDYPRASVVVFKNDVLSLDPELLKEQAVSVQPIATNQKTVTMPVTDIKPSNKVGVYPPDKDTLKTATRKAEPVKTAITETDTKKTENTKTPSPVSEVKKDIVVFRVQFLTNSTPKGSFKITIAGKSYNTFEYQYAGAYRSTVGDFSTLAAATELQKAIRLSGYPQAFVVVFKNNVRSIDPALFK